jgi:hypothetical protein
VVSADAVAPWTGLPTAPVNYYSGKDDVQQTRRWAAHAAQRSKRPLTPLRCVRGPAGLLVTIFVAEGIPSRRRPMRFSLDSARKYVTLYG